MTRVTRVSVILRRVARENRGFAQGAREACRVHNGPRMTALRTTLCLLSLVGVSGFSHPPTSACEHVASSYVGLNQKIATCATGAVLPFDAVACQSNTQTCTGSDRATIDAFLGCVDQLPSCADEADFRGQLERCAAGARLSPGCSL